PEIVTPTVHPRLRGPREDPIVHPHTLIAGRHHRPTLIPNTRMRRVRPIQQAVINRRTEPRIDTHHPTAVRPTRAVTDPTVPDHHVLRPHLDPTGHPIPIDHRAVHRHRQPPRHGPAEH